MISGITWGLDTVLLNKAYSYSPLNGNWSAFTSGAVPTMIHDLISACLLLLFCSCLCLFKEMKFAFTQRGLFWMILASICGAPIGMLGYLLAINYIGGGYTAAISALYPALGAFLAFLFLRDRLLAIGWFGLGLAVIGTIGTSLSAIFASDASVEEPVLGVVFALMCVVGWGVECVIADYAFRHYSMHPSVCLLIRQTTSAVVYNAFVLPINGSVSFELVREMFKDSSIWWIVGASLSGTISYLCYYAAIDRLGATQAIALNITYAVWTIIIGLFFSITPSYIWLIIICIILICIGSFLCSGLGKEPRAWILIKSWFDKASIEELEEMKKAVEDLALENAAKNLALDEKKAAKKAAKNDNGASKEAAAPPNDIELGVVHVIEDDLA